MKNKLIKRARFFCLAFFLLYIVLIAAPCFAAFRFAVIGDTQGGRQGINKAVFRSLMEELRSEDPDFIVFVGDITAGSGDGKRYDLWPCLICLYP